MNDLLYYYIGIGVLLLLILVIWSRISDKKSAKRSAKLLEDYTKQIERRKEIANAFKEAATKARKRCQE